MSKIEMWFGLQRLEGMRGGKSVFSGFDSTSLRPQGPGPCHCSFNLQYPIHLLGSIKSMLHLMYFGMDFYHLQPRVVSELSVISSGRPSLTTLANLVLFLPLVTLSCPVLCFIALIAL